MSTEIRINHKGWVITAKPIQYDHVTTAREVDYIYKYNALGMAASIFRRALISTSDYTYSTYMELPDYERESIVRTWLDKSRAFGLVEEPNVVYE